MSALACPLPLISLQLQQREALTVRILASRICSGSPAVGNGRVQQRPAVDWVRRACQRSRISGLLLERQPKFCTAPKPCPSSEFVYHFVRESRRFEGSRGTVDTAMA
ncbi:hypothetical protein L1887_57353 [Cichorium endivia]|nr:hypothetical protein L1887_57353 [Cichorium endivia]